MIDERTGLADIFRRAAPAYRNRHSGKLDAGALRILDCLERCRTPALGGTVYQCTGCGRPHAVWRSCGNRHCPTCQGAAARKWMEKQAGCILPVPYFHVVFTLPRPIARIALHNRDPVFNILFRTAAETLKTISADPRRLAARIGGTAVMHSWNQKMEWHPHLHCLVPNGGFDVESGKWKTGSSSYFAPVKVLASFFRRRFLEELEKAFHHRKLNFHGASAHLADHRNFAEELRQARMLDWNVYAKPPFKGPEADIRYLSRYTHRVAITNARILAFDGKAVTFRYRKPAKGAAERPAYASMTLPSDEFIRRFLMHRPPRGFHRIRHFRNLKAIPLAKRKPLPPGDGGDAEETANPWLPACPGYGEPLWPVFSIGANASQARQDFARQFMRQRGPPQSTAPA